MSERSLLKEKLRKEYLNNRQSLSEYEVESKSHKIVEKLLHLKEFDDAEIVHSYVSILKNREADTRMFISRCFELGKEVVVPKMIGDGNLNNFYIESLDELEENSLGIPEPVTKHRFTGNDMDLFIIPMVVGDSHKNRIGYGGGYYDRLLDQYECPKIGLLFDCQLFDGTLPTEEFDVSLDLLITESGIID